MTEYLVQGIVKYFYTDFLKKKKKKHKKNQTKKQQQQQHNNNCNPSDLYKFNPSKLISTCNKSLPHIIEPRHEKTVFCICENKDGDQLGGNREADQRLCFRYTDSTAPLLSEPEISSL